MSADHRGIAWNLAEFSPEEQARITGAWIDGYAAGVNAGRRAVEAEDEARWVALRQTMRAVASSRDYATLAELRGQPERAEKQRRTLAERGIGQGPLVVLQCPVCNTDTAPWSCSCGATRTDRGLS